MRTPFKTSILALGTAAVVFASAACVFGADAFLAWDPPVINEDGSELTDLVGYRVYWGTSSGSYTKSEDVITGATSARIGGLGPGKRYYFTVTAINSAAMESPFSEELVWTVPLPDRDKDGLPDDWENSRFEREPTGEADPDADDDGDGVSNYGEYLAGTDPMSPESGLAVSIRPGEGGLAVEFCALAVSGVEEGYAEGMTRHYRLESCVDLAGGAWVPVEGSEDISVTGEETIRLEVPARTQGQAVFYRVVCCLQ